MKVQKGETKIVRIAALLSLVLALVLGFGLVSNREASAGVPAKLPSAAKPASPASVASKLDQAVLQDTANGKSASFIILMADQANVTAGYSMRDQNARGWYVYSTLSQHAERSQADIKAALRAQGISYQSFWVANMLVVSGNRSLVDAMAARPDVAKIEANRSFRGIDDPVGADNAVPSDTKDTPYTVEWGVQNVNAPQVWAMGYTGQGIVIGNQDTGMRWTHNAIKAHYRGAKGTPRPHFG